MPADPNHLLIVSYPDPVLRTKATEVASVDDEVRAVAHRMVELMRDAEGIGLAAPQVGLPWRLFVVELPSHPDEPAAPDGMRAHTDGPQVYINPVLVDPVGAPTSLEEGCLSLPGIRGRVLRPEQITIEATDLAGERFRETAIGLLAKCWQHEFDHLDGVLILDRMDQMSRLKNRSAIRTLEKDAAVR